MIGAASQPRMRSVRVSPTLSAYIARQFAIWYLGFLLGLVGVILLVSTVELLDRMAAKDSSLGVVLSMALLKLPFLTQEIMPFTVLFAGLACFWRLTRSNELVVARAAGISIWQVLLPSLLTALVIGALTAAALNPIASILLGRFEHLEAKYVHNQSSTLMVSRGGLWLRQADPTGQSVIHAQRVTDETLTLHGVTIFRFEEQDRFVDRIDAARADLAEGAWVLTDAWQARPGDSPRFTESLELATELTREKVLDSFAPPETISFWSLPGFIALLENAGFTAIPHKLQYHRLLATPLLFAAMILLAATFSLRPSRRGRVGLVIMGGVFTGFLLYFLSNFVFALGLSGKIPVVLSAWTPAGVTMMLGMAMLLHLEDG